MNSPVRERPGSELLQPSLFERLVDPKRVVATLQVLVDPSRLRELQIPIPALRDILSAQGLTPAVVGSASTPGDAGPLVLNFLCSRGDFSLSQLRNLTLTPPAKQPVVLQSFCQFELQMSVNTELDAMPAAQLTMRQVRRRVREELSLLLNSVSLDTTMDLDELPEVRRSVLNYGLPSYAGRLTASMDARETARRIAAAIEYFEPRVTEVQVLPAGDGGTDDEHAWTFRIDAQLVGPVSSERLTLTTRIDTDSGDVRVNDEQLGDSPN